MFGGRSGSRSTATAPQPVMHHQRPQPVPVHQSAPAQSGGAMSGIGGAIVTGMAMGTGSEIAHQAIRGIMGSGSGSGHQAPPQQQQQQQYAPM